MTKRTHSILVADDSEDFRLFAAHHLEGVSYSLAFASDGEEAVELYAQGNFDLVIMDIIMPLMDGVDAIKAIRKVEAERKRERVPVLALSAETSVETGVDSMGAGADRMLLKPVTRAGLLETVASMLGLEGAQPG